MPNIEVTSIETAFPELVIFGILCKMDFRNVSYLPDRGKMSEAKDNITLRYVSSICR